MHRTIIIIVLVSLLGISTPMHAATSLKALSLGLADLPAGCVRDSQALLGAADLARRDGAAMSEVAAYIEDFTGDAMRCPFVDLAALITRYTSSAKAHNAYRKIAQQRPPAPSQQQTRLPMPAIGDERVGAVLRLLRQRQQEIDINIVFRRDNYLFVLVVDGVTKRFVPTKAVHLSHLVDYRIQHTS